MAKVYRFEQFNGDPDLVIRLTVSDSKAWSIQSDTGKQLLWDGGDVVEAMGETLFRKKGALVYCFSVAGLASQLQVDEQISVVSLGQSAFRTINSEGCAVIRES